MSDTIRLASGIAAALETAETSANQAMIDLLAVGTAMFHARQNDAVHNLECQRGVEFFGAGVAKMTEGMTELARAHREIVKVGVEHKVLSSGELCNIPPPGASHSANVTPIKLDKVG